MNGNEIRYSAAGEKLRVTHLTAVPNITVPIGTARELAPSEILSTDSTDYLLGGTLTMKNGRIDRYLFDEGYCQASKYASNPVQDGFTPYYFDRDHLGSVRQVIKAYGSTKGTVVQRMEYYPSGLQFCDNTTDSDVQPQRYNGKEYDKMHGLCTYDYGARQYNPVTARWDRMDPLCEKYYDISPYAYCGNNPVNAVDPDGRDWYMTSDSIVQWIPEVTSQDNTPDGGTYIGKEYMGLTIDIYEEYYGEGENGLSIGIIYDSQNLGERWIQSVSTEYEDEPDANNGPNCDRSKDYPPPFYYTNVEETFHKSRNSYYFEDRPSRDSRKTVNWNAELTLARPNNGYKPVVTLNYGFRNNNGLIRLNPITISVPSPFQNKLISDYNARIK